MCVPAHARMDVRHRRQATCSSLGGVLYSQGKYAESEAVYRGLLELQTRLFDDPVRKRARAHTHTCLSVSPSPRLSLCLSAITSSTIAFHRVALRRPQPCDPVLFTYWPRTCAFTSLCNL